MVMKSTLKTSICQIALTPLEHNKVPENPWEKSVTVTVKEQFGTSL
jgi:hypothetical protein